MNFNSDLFVDICEMGSMMINGVNMVDILKFMMVGGDLLDVFDIDLKVISDVIFIVIVGGGVLGNIVLLNEVVDLLEIGGCVEFFVEGMILVGLKGIVLFDVIIFNSFGLVMIVEVGDFEIKGDNSVGILLILIMVGGNIIDVVGIVVEVNGNVLFVVDVIVDNSGLIMFVEILGECFDVVGIVRFMVLNSIEVGINGVV